MNAAISVVGSSLVYRLLYNRVEHEYLPLLAIICVLPFVLIFGEIVPKTLGVRNPERLAAMNSLPLYWFSRFIAPVRDGLSWISHQVLRITGSSVSGAGGVSEEVFRSMVDAGTEEGVLDAREQRMIHSVFNLDDLRVDRFMTPFEKVSYLQSKMTIREALKKIDSERYSRFPVLDEEKKVVGTLYSKDLLGVSDLDPDASILPLIRAPLLVPRETTALHLFAQFRSKRTHFGMVCGTFAHEMIGVVTLEDVLEQVFGDIRDERDMDEGTPSKP